MLHSLALHSHLNVQVFFVSSRRRVLGFLFLFLSVGGAVKRLLNSRGENMIFSSGSSLVFGLVLP